MRKAFNFFRSYYDVASELSDKDRLAFYDALILEQFTGKKTELKGLAKFAYISQRHSIDSQTRGYNDRLKRTDIQSDEFLIAGGAAGAEVGGEAQEKVQEKEKVQISKKVIKVSFEESEIFNKNTFKNEFPLWNTKKLSYYYDAAIAYSNEGNKYANWKSAINNWAKRDELQGKFKFDEKNGIDTKNKLIIY
jgi:hypothetical protein